MSAFFCQIEDALKARLNDEETRHLKVLRIKEGETIQCLDGKGTFYDCVVEKIGKDYTELSITGSVQISGLRNFRLHLYVAPTKNADRMEWLLEKAVEVGLDSITFIETEHSEKHRVNMSRMERIAISALKQSGQSHLPTLNDLKKLSEIEVSGLKLFAHCAVGPKEKLSKLFSEPIAKGTDIHVFIGPEGDFSKNEIETFGKKQFTAISLGDARLRTETAALYSVVVINALA